MSIRWATAADVHRLQDIEAAAGRRFAEIGMADISEHPPTATAELLTAVAEKCLWVAEAASEDGGESAVGFALVKRLSGSLHLEELSVAPSHGRRGIGSALVRHVARVAAAEGYRRLTLSTFADVPWNGPFYRRLGFEILREDDLSAELREIRQHEAQVGLDVEHRVMMSFRLESVRHEDPYQGKTE